MYFSVLKLHLFDGKALEVRKQTCPVTGMYFLLFQIDHLVFFLSQTNIRRCSKNRLRYETRRLRH